ncbi:MAG: acyltransferase family protein, partial [Brevundimonas sp.]|uniref:acyltransferase family protein n=1 Tax=Brevundimonas sp. TaxID=1871086 RepID=UPI0027324C6F
MSSTGVATEEISARRQLKTLQVGRGLAALAVLLYHASITLALPKYLDDPVATWALAGSSGVHFFFVLSGVIITLAHLGQINHPQKASAFLWRRFRRIYPPLWVACGLSIIGMMFVGAGIPDAGSLFSAFALTPVEHERVLAVAWTLRHEVVFYILFMTLILSVRLGVAALAI